MLLVVDWFPQHGGETNEHRYQLYHVVVGHDRSADKNSIDAMVKDPSG